MVIKKRKPMSKSTKLKISIANKGSHNWSKHSPKKRMEICKKISEATRNRYIRWNRLGIEYHSPNLGKDMSEEQKRKISFALKGRKFKNGRKQWNIGLDSRIIVICSHCKKEVKKLPSEIKNNKQYFCNYQCFYDSLKGRKIPEETMIKIRKNNPAYQPGSKSPFWRGGYSRKGYAEQFNDKLKEQIRNRDNHKCKICGVPGIECIHKLSVHHIDYNKLNNNSNNLISLCIKCHAHTSGSNDIFRKKWIEYFTNNGVYPMTRQEGVQPN